MHLASSVIAFFLTGHLDVIYLHHKGKIITNLKKENRSYNGVVLKHGYLTIIMISTLLKANVPKQRHRLDIF